jgi:predicted GIY-YIG superfamily endonuclease
LRKNTKSTQLKAKRDETQTRDSSLFLIFDLTCEYPYEAYYREKQIYGWSHAKKQALIKGREEELTLIFRLQIHEKL